MDSIDFEEITGRTKSILTGIATGEKDDNHQLQHEYEKLRSKLIANPEIKKLLPEFVLSCRNLNEFWGYIQPKFKTYAERRKHLQEEFFPLLEAIETNKINSPSDLIVSGSLKNLDSNEINRLWKKAIDRRVSDPKGALTAARSLLESTLKHILDDLNQSYDDKADLQKLYKQTAALLNLAPSTQTEKTLKQLLSGCHNVVEGIGSMRNNFSDAHGKGRTKVDLSDHHIELGVNMAGFLAIFWIKVFKEHQKSNVKF